LAADPVLSVRDLATHFELSGGTVKAVDGVDFDIGAGEILTVVGESGSGKSVTALSIMRLIVEPGRIVRGEVRLGGRDLLRLRPGEMQQVRGRAIAMVFQNPYASLHPMYRIGSQMDEVVRLHARRIKDAAAGSRELLTRIHVDDPETVLRSYPFEVSAGVCQRVMLAMALAARPALLIADEPTTNLDALAQAEILALIKEMRDAYGMSVLLITHDFSVVSAMADRVLVMYAGRPAESGPAKAVLAEPIHPYAKGLIGSVMNARTRARRLTQISGEVPDVMHLPAGCSFRPRCSEAFSRCGEDPPMSDLGNLHRARCWRADTAGRSHG
jgi:oligopeptide/dipeptide ABC transporter ATP-binding protein